MQAWQLEVRKPQAAVVEKPEEQAQVNPDERLVGKMNLQGPLADQVSQLLLAKYGHDKDPQLAGESWDLTAGDMTMQATAEPDPESNPDLWVYVVDGRTVSNAEVVMAMEWGRSVPTDTQRLIVVECYGRVTPAIEHMAQYAKSAKIEMNMSKSAGVSTIVDYYRGK